MTIEDGTVNGGMRANKIVLDFVIWQQTGHLLNALMVEKYVDL